MLKGDISNKQGLIVSVDFDAIVTKKATMRQAVWIDRLERWWPWAFKKLQAKILAMTVEVSPDAHAAGWFLSGEVGLRVFVIIRRQYSPGLTKAVEEILKDYPAHRIHLIPELDLPIAGAKIRDFCKHGSIHRFFTTDVELARTMPTRYTTVVDDWLDFGRLIRD